MFSENCKLFDITNNIRSTRKVIINVFSGVCDSVQEGGRERVHPAQVLSGQVLSRRGGRVHPA